MHPTQGLQLRTIRLAGFQALRIIFTVNAAWNVWNFRQPLVTGLIADGHEVIILAPEDDTRRAIEATGCRFVPLKMRVKGLNPLSDASLILRMRSHFKTIQPDLVFGFTIKNNISGALAARSLGIPFVPNVTGLGTAFLSNGVLRRVAETYYRLAFSGLPAIFFQNPEDRDFFVERGLATGAQARVLPGSGIDLTHFRSASYPSDGQPVVFLMISRILRDKGVLEFVEAAKIVRQTHPDARFQLLGPAAAQNRTAISLDTVRAWEHTHGVEYLGVSKDVREQIANAHCVVLPSYREGAPRTLIEAAAMARPVIATDVPGCRSVVDDGRNGYLCASRSAESLARACRRFLNVGHALQQQMGLAGRHKIEQSYDQRLVLEFYRDIIAHLGSDEAQSDLTSMTPARGYG